ncbi:MAG TPA: nucleoside phosphorylase [Haloplasmataceae bacterium]
MKKEFPILEFDPTKEAMIEPRRKVDVKIPNRLVICFFREVIAKLLEKKEILPLVTLSSETNDIIIYKFVDSECCLVQGILGAPACAGFFEEFIALGVDKAILCGGAGVLKKDVTFGRLVVVESAIRDEGFSYHYIEPSREIQANQEVIKHITNYLDNHHIDYIVGKTWTTDAFYRETKAKIALRKKEGCLIVEMEQAAMFAVSQFRNIQYGAIIYGGDDLTQDKWDPRAWRNRDDIRTSLCKLCKDIVLSL